MKTLKNEVTMNEVRRNVMVNVWARLKKMSSWNNDIKKHVMRQEWKKELYIKNETFSTNKYKNEWVRVIDFVPKTAKSFYDTKGDFVNDCEVKRNSIVVYGRKRHVVIYYVGWDGQEKIINNTLCLKDDREEIFETLRNELKK